MAIDGSITFFESNGYEIEAKITSTKVGDVQADIRRCRATDLYTSGGPARSRIKCRTCSRSLGPCPLPPKGDYTPGPSDGTGRTNFSGVEEDVGTDVFDALEGIVAIVVAVVGEGGNRVVFKEACL